MLDHVQQQQQERIWKLEGQLRKARERLRQVAFTDGLYGEVNQLAQSICYQGIVESGGVPEHWKRKTSDAAY